MGKLVVAYIGVGSNLCQPKRQIKRARRALANIAHTKVISVSSWYQNPAIGPEQPDYINGVIAIKTRLSALTLLNNLQQIENRQGRERMIHWGPRTIDLDILLYGKEQINLDRLKIPHHEIKNRSFVLYPLFEISPHIRLPKGPKIKSLINYAETQKLVKLPIRNI